MRLDWQTWRFIDQNTGSQLRSNYENKLPTIQTQSTAML